MGEHVGAAGCGHQGQHCWVSPPPSHVINPMNPRRQGRRRHRGMEGVHTQQRDLGQGAAGLGCLEPLQHR